MCEGAVQRDARAAAGERLYRTTGARVAAKEKVRHPGQLESLHLGRCVIGVRGALGELNLGARSDVEACLDDGVVTKRDAYSGISAEQHPVADGDPLRAATRKRAHDRGTTPDIAAFADHHAL